MADNNLICIAAIIGAFGIKGELRVKSFCAEPSDLASYGPLFNEDGDESYDLRIVSPIKGGFSCRIKGVQYKDQADALKGIQLYTNRANLPSLPDDEYYHSDLVDLDVYDTGGEKLGYITAVHDHGAGDFLEIAGKGIKNTVLLPFTLDAVPTVDLKAGRIITDPPQGVFPEAKDER
ncbi:MAG: 16S rRNA processing protein RimM [Amylibacter sp.]|nr:16S rRNA processing protein RimM [Amylibacter sp.]